MITPHAHENDAEREKIKDSGRREKEGPRCLLAHPGQRAPPAPQKRRRRTVRRRQPPPPISRLRPWPADTNANANGRRKRRKPPPNPKTTDATARTTPTTAGSPPHLEPRASPRRGMWAYIKRQKRRSRNTGRARNKDDGAIPIVDSHHERKIPQEGPPRNTRQDADTDANPSRTAKAE